MEPLDQTMRLMNMALEMERKMTDASAGTQDWNQIP